jgi:hypothetical protein
LAATINLQWFDGTMSIDTATGEHIVIAVSGWR